MSLAVGFPFVYNNRTQEYEQVYICTRASEIIFDDTETLEYKLQSGQLNGKDGEAGTDGVTTTVMVAGATEWKDIGTVRASDGGKTLADNTVEGAQFVNFQFLAEDEKLYQCYGYWMKRHSENGDVGAGTILAWTPEFGIWELFGMPDGSLTSQRTYPLDWMTWHDLGTVDTSNGGAYINSNTHEGMNCVKIIVTAGSAVESQKGWGYWLKTTESETVTTGAGLFFCQDGNIRFLFKNPSSDALEGLVIGTSGISNVNTVTGAGSSAVLWTEMGNINATTVKALPLGLSCVHGNYLGVEIWGYWIKYSDNRGMGLWIGSNAEIRFVSYTPPNSQLDGFLLWDSALKKSDITGGTSNTSTISGGGSYINVTVSGTNSSAIGSTINSACPDNCVSNVLVTWNGYKHAGIWFKQSGAGVGIFCQYAGSGVSRPYKWYTADSAGAFSRLAYADSSPSYTDIPKTTTTTDSSGGVATNISLKQIGTIYNLSQINSNFSTDGLYCIRMSYKGQYLCGLWIKIGTVGGGLFQGTTDGNWYLGTSDDKYYRIQFADSSTGSTATTSSGGTIYAYGTQQQIGTALISGTPVGQTRAVYINFSGVTGYGTFSRYTGNYGGGIVVNHDTRLRVFPFCVINGTFYAQEK